MIAELGEKMGYRIVEEVSLVVYYELDSCCRGVVDHSVHWLRLINIDSG